jgi:hypothetical protein
MVTPLRGKRVRGLGWRAPVSDWQFLAFREKHVERQTPQRVVVLNCCVTERLACQYQGIGQRRDNVHFRTALKSLFV